MEEEGSENEEEGEEEGEEDEDDEEEEEEPTPIVVKELPKRSTRGQRMNALMGKALEEDEQFWNSGIFAGAAQDVESSDQDYNSKEESASAG